MSEVVLGDVVLHPGYIVCDEEEHRVPQLLPVHVHRLGGVMCLIVKLREREGQRVDLGRSLKGHL